MRNPLNQWAIKILKCYNCICGTPIGYDSWMNDIPQQSLFSQMRLEKIQ